MNREQAEQIARKHVDLRNKMEGHEDALSLSVTVDAIMEAVAMEREACAKACEDEAVDADATNEKTDIAYNTALSHAAYAIRARGER